MGHYFNLVFTYKCFYLNAPHQHIFIVGSSQYTKETRI